MNDESLWVVLDRSKSSPTRVTYAMPIENVGCLVLVSTQLANDCSTRRECVTFVPGVQVAHRDGKPQLEPIAGYGSMPDLE